MCTDTRERMSFLLEQWKNFKYVYIQQKIKEKQIKKTFI